MPLIYTEPEDVTDQDAAVSRMINQPTDADGIALRDGMIAAVNLCNETDARAVLRFLFRSGIWHVFYVLDAKAEPDHVARKFLPGYMKIFAAIESNPAIWRRCLDKAKAQPETLP